MIEKRCPLHDVRMFQSRITGWTCSYCQVVHQRFCRAVEEGRKAAERAEKVRLIADAIKLALSEVAFSPRVTTNGGAHNDET